MYGDSYRTQLDLSLPLWAGGGLAASVAGERQSLNARREGGAAARRAVQGEVVQRFFAQAAASSLQRARQQGLARAEGRLEESRHRQAVGLATRQEVLRWLLEVDSARAELAAAEGHLLVARLELADTLGLGLGFDSGQLGELRLPDPPVVDALLAWAADLQAEEVLLRAADELQDLPEHRVAVFQEEAASQAVRASRSALLPRADLATTFGWLENNTVALDEFTNWSATLLLTVPVDLRGDLRCEVRQAAARHQVAAVAVADAEAALHLAVGRALAEVLRSRTALVSARRAVDEASARHDLLSRQSEAGLASLLDLVDADTTLVAAEVAQATAETDFLAAVAALELAWPGADPPAGGLIP